MSGAGEIRLTCQPGKEGRFLVFPYCVQNDSHGVAYVMDAAPSVAGPGGKAVANPNAVVVVHGPGGDATIGKFIAPLPSDRRIAMPVIPLARRLAPGEALQGRIEIPVPLAETSPYFAELPLRQYEPVELKAVVLTIGYWLAGTDGLVALPVPYAPEYFSVTLLDSLRSAMVVAQRFPTRQLQLFRRTDHFPRDLPCS